MRREDLLDLNDALQHPGRTVAVDIVTELSDEADIDLLEPVTGFIEAVSTGNLLLLEGEFKTKCVVECARCGAPLETSVEYKMDEQFPVEGVPSSYASDDYAKVVAEEDFPLFEGNSLMAENLIRQGLLLNLPVQPLCSYGWDGDCPNARNMQEQGFEKPKSQVFSSLGALLSKEEKEAP